jgi:hypothetical protein
MNIVPTPPAGTPGTHQWALTDPIDGATAPYSYSYLILIYIILTTLKACPSCRSTLMRPSLTSSFIALCRVLRDILVASAESTISPPICSRLNASNSIVWANRYVFTLLDRRNASTHRELSFTHCVLKRGWRFLFTPGRDGIFMSAICRLSIILPRN